jgi:CHU_C Type IX secretion signal domain
MKILIYVSIFLGSLNVCWAQGVDTLSIESKDTCLLYVPEGIYPCADINQCFGATYSCEVYDFEMAVYNRWGELKYISYDISDCWQGNDSKGMLLQDGFYPWRLRFKRNGKKYEYSGTVKIYK